MTAATVVSVARTVLFADVVGSTRLYEQVGDARALEAIGGCLRALSTVAGRYQGRVVKTLGDEIMVAFDAPDAALRAATEMQTEMQQRAPGAGSALQIRAGFHHGEVIERDGDLFGDTVNVAARMAGLARAGQILTTGRTVEQLPAYARHSVRSLDALAVKGKQDALAVCEVIWQWGEGLTMMDGVAPPPQVHEPELVIEHARGSTRLDALHATLALGRDAAAEIVLAHPKASRNHARIERRRDKFVVVDTSTNGTYVRIDGDRELQLRREEIVLRGTGTLSCGAASDTPGAEVLRFRID